MHKISGKLAITDGEAVVSSADLVLNRLFSDAQQLSLGTLPDNDLHRIRILSKQMRYIITTVQHIYPDFRFRGITTDSLRELETTTGNWHDCLVKVELVSRWFDKPDHTEDAAMLKYNDFLEDSKAELGYSYTEACEIARKVLNSESGEK
jgi:CHAD domain-containing protein